MADTNVLVRLVVGDDDAQERVAAETLRDAEIVVLDVHSLCELVWVLRRQYRTAIADIAATIRGLLGLPNIVVDRPTVEAGLRMLDGGGDFADGVVAYEGERLGGDTFVSFDRKAVALLAREGRRALLLTA